MSSIGLSLGMEVAKSALNTAQGTIAVISNNIANASDSSYHKQSATITQNMPITGDDGNIYGSGSSVTAITRSYDASLEESLRDATSSNSYAQLYYSKLSSIEDVVGTDGDSALNTAVQNFADALEDVESNPDDTSTRTAFEGACQTLSQTFNQQYSSLTSAANTIATNDSTGSGSVSDEVDQVNSLLDQITKLNDSISSIESNVYTNASANNLRDQRDSLVSQLSQYVSIDVSEESNGKYTIKLNTEGTDQTLVDGTKDYSTPPNTLKLSMVAPVDPSTDYTTQISVVNAVSGGTTNVTLAEGGGEIRALIDSRNYMLDQRSNLYTYASEFGDTVSDSIEPTRRAISTSYSSGDYVESDPPNGYVYICTGAGTSSSGSITWPTTVDATVTDGSVTWKCVAKYSTVNAAHMTGYDLNGDTGIKIFNLGTSDSSTILSVNSNFTDDPSKVAASTTSGEAGDGSNMANMYSTINTNISGSPFYGTSILDYGNTFVNAIALDVSNSSTAADTASSLKSMYQDSIASISGVSTDEELTHMLEVQRMYQAAAKLITAIDEMTTTALQMT